MATTQAQSTAPGSIRSLVPARLDRLRWSKFHTRLVVALGVAWVLDGLEITIAAAIGSDLTRPATLHMSSGVVGDIATWYLVGEVIGAIFSGYLSDRLGRRNLFTITLGVYLIGSALTAATWSGSAGGSAYLYLTRVIAGMGIGGEYAAINSAIDELIPAHYRGCVDIAVNGTYWAGAILGTLGSLIVLNHVPDAWVGESRSSSDRYSRSSSCSSASTCPKVPAGSSYTAASARPRRKCCGSSAGVAKRASWSHSTTQRRSRSSRRSRSIRFRCCACSSTNIRRGPCSVPR
jgi:hypothetical protein